MEWTAQFGGGEYALSGAVGEVCDDLAQWCAQAA